MWISVWFKEGELMAVGDKALDYLKRKKAGTHMLLLNFSGDMEKQAKSNGTWKDQTSHARQSIHSGVEGGGNSFTLFLAHGAKYGKYLEEGTPPHKIRPKNKKALSWAGASHPVKEVNHPGTDKHPVLEDTLRGNKKALKEAIGEYWANE